MQNKAAGVLFQAQKCKGLQKERARSAFSSSEVLHCLLHGEKLQAVVLQLP